MWFSHCDKEGGKDCGCGHGHGRGLKSLLWIALAVYLVLLSRNAAKQFDYIGRPESQRDTIAIAAEGKVTALPDIASVSVGVQTEQKNVSEAQSENTRKMNAIIAKLKDLGVAKEDIKTTNYSIYPLYDYPNGRQVARGYSVSQNVDVKIRKLDSIGQVLAAVGELGANQVGGVTFTIDDPEELRQQARMKGLEAAKQKAQALAEAADVRLGKVVGFSESVGGYYPPPIYAKALEAYGGGAGGPAPSIEQGSQEVIVNVSVSYEIL